MKLCIALDNEYPLELARLIRDHFPSQDIWMKIGAINYIKEGNHLIEKLKLMNFNIFLDMKLYDIPNTMKKAVENISNLPVDMLSIHASAGSTAMRCCRDVVGDKLKIVAITALTSFEDREFHDIYNTSITSCIPAFLQGVSKAKIDAVACSPSIAPIIRSYKNKDEMMIVTPGIVFYPAPYDYYKNNNMFAAHMNGSDMIVVGREIYNTADPIEKIKKILTAIDSII